MIVVKNKAALARMYDAGQKLADIFSELSTQCVAGITTSALDAWIDQALRQRDLVSATRGYRGYRHVSCISVNEVLVHGVPSERTIGDGDIVKVDICAHYRNYCADMARCFFIGSVPHNARNLVATAQRALDAGIAAAHVGNRVGDISGAIEDEIVREGYGIVREFCGHGIGRSMHEDPEVPNYRTGIAGAVLRHGMACAIEPMITQGTGAVKTLKDGWTVVSADDTLTAHVEDTVVITEHGPCVITRHDAGRML